MINFDEILASFVILWAVIDPIGTIPVFIAVTRKYDQNEKLKIARTATYVAFAVLLFFMVVGEFILRKVGVPLAAFQTSGGIILFLFAVDMIFGSSKPESEIELIKSGSETAIFPLAIPSIAGPGPILAVVLLADHSRHSWPSMLISLAVLISILIINYFFMKFSGNFHRRIGNSGAIVISKVMGLILASVAANNILLGIKDFFKIKGF